MSFKRDGDDAGQLAVLRKRRVADLLANCIPEDEALLLRSGRYACTLCPHRPTFDTLRVLAVHRAGRKHLSKAVVSTHTERSGPRRAPPSPPPNRPAPISPTRRRELQRILQLRSSGWIQDRSGKWVKDENAEFDSDEEEPPALLPP
ncbi:UNVERIFIED_CONTAM: hypothetical protein H355_015632 [Colinus virginianus]|nr:hypothetical protein H355_015632 [Colinus virginianus]